MTEALAGAQPLDVAASEVVRLVQKYERLPEEKKDAKLLRQAADIIVRARVEHFVTPEGGIDLAGHSYGYRLWMGDIYKVIARTPEDRIEIGNRIRYHLGQALRENIEEDDLEDAGLASETLNERAKLRRGRRGALVDLARPGGRYTAEEAWEALQVMSGMAARFDATQFVEGDGAAVRGELQRLSSRLRDLAKQLS